MQQLRQSETAGACIGAQIIKDCGCARLADLWTDAVNTRVQNGSSKSTAIFINP